MLKKHPKGEKGFVRRLLYNEACAVADNIVELKVAEKNIFKYLNSFEVKIIDKLWVKAFLIVYKLSPELVKAVYRKGKQLKNRG